MFRQHYEKMYNLAKCILSAWGRGAKLYDELRMLKIIMGNVFTHLFFVSLQSRIE